MTATTILAIWGAVLSTALAVVKLWEIYRDRFRISSSINFDGTGENRTVVSIYNHHKDTIIITALDLFWTTNLKKEELAYHPEIGFEQGCNLTIPAHEVKPLVFKEMYYFGCRQDKGNLYMRVHIAGRKKSITQLLFAA